MTKLLACPDRDTLERLLLGQIAYPQGEEFAQHLEECDRCTAVAAMLGVEDTLVAAAQGIAPEEPQQEAVRDLIERLRQCGPPSSDSPLPEEADATAEGPDREHLAPPPPIATIRDYELLEPIGHGGMGAVYKARHTKLKRVVALKLLPEGRAPSPAAVRRFEREMEAVGKLKHANIVHAYDAGEEAGRRYLVMEHVEGIDLARLSKQHGRLPIPEACEIVRQAALGLQHAHEHGLVHRDIKPSNLMLALSYQPSAFSNQQEKLMAEGCLLKASVKILDLGLALLRDDPAAAAEAADRSPAAESDAPTLDGPHSSGTKDDLTGTQVMGTCDYMAPEQAVHAHVVDIRADIYSLGCTLYKLLAGRAPFESPEYGASLQKLAAHAQIAVPLLQEHRPEVPEALAALVHRMLAKAPAARFATPAEVAGALSPFATASDLAALVGAGTETPLSRSGGHREVVGVGVAELPSPVSGEGPGVRGKRRLALATGAAAIILLGVLLTLSTGKGTVQLEFSDAEAARQCTISIDGDEIRLENLGEPIKLRPGKHELRVTHGDLEIETREFTVLRRGTQLLHVSIPGVSREPALVKAPAPADKSSIRWLGYTVRHHPAKSIAEIADYTNIVFDHGWPNYGDELIKAARKAGLKVVLAFYGVQEKDLFADKGIVLARDNRDVVFAVCWYGQNDWKPSGFPAFGSSLKRQLPGIELWAAFHNRHPADDFAVPDAVDVLLVTFRGPCSVKTVQEQAAAAFPYWKDRAKGRPVLVYWDCWFRKRAAGRLIETWPGTMYACAQVAEQHGLSGVIFDNYGTEAADIGLRRTGPVYENYGLETGDLARRLEHNISVGMGVQTRPELIVEIKRVARELGVAKESSVSGKPAGLDLRIGDAEVAIAAYSEVIQSNPAAFEPYFERGLFYLRAGDMERAIGDFRQAVRLTSDLPPSWSRWLSWWLPTTIDSRSKLPGILFVSDMPWVRSTCGPGGQAARCSGPIKAVDSSELPYSRSVFTFTFRDATPADVVLDISRQNFATFKSQVGCAFGLGTVQFQVLADGQVKHQTAVLRQGAVDTVSVDVKGAKEVVLRVLNGGDGNENVSDGAAWGSARFVQAGAADLLEEPGEIRFATDASSALLLAEVHWRLNEKDRARRWFDAAAAWMDKHPAEAEKLRPYRTEAAKTLGK